MHAQYIFLDCRRAIKRTDSAIAMDIFSTGEIGQVDDPAVDTATARQLQQAAHVAGAVQAADAGELEARIVADHSTALPALVLLGRDRPPIVGDDYYDWPHLLGTMRTAPPGRLCGFSSSATGHG